MREAENSDEVKQIRQKLEFCYLQGEIEEAVKLGRRLDEMQCQLFRKISEPQTVAG